MITRRSVLLGAGGGLAVAVGGGALFATTRTPHAALAPWEAPGTLAEDPRVKALEWAILVPNPHNRQPWNVELVGRDEVVLTCDLDRRLPMTDPYDRQITIGLGCFVEMFALAAASEGLSTKITPFPEGEPGETARLDQRPVAHLLLHDGGTPDPLFAHAPHRRTNKEPYEDRAIDAAHLEAVIAEGTRTSIGATTDPSMVETLRQIAAEAWLIESATPRTHKESVDLMRFGKAEINANPDGIDLGGPMLEALHLAGLLTPKTMVDPQSTAFAQGEAMYADLFNTAKGWIWVTTEDNSRAAQLAAGRDWLRANLAATGVGLAVQPMSQCLQEYEEVAPLLAQTHDALGTDGTQRVQLLARAGYGPTVAPSPRWPAASRVVKRG
ncbi:MAG: twin-arginine translocation pathway signal protein [Pseudomonadota bacterium]